MSTSDRRLEKWFLRDRLKQVIAKFAGAPNTPETREAMAAAIADAFPGEMAAALRELNQQDGEEEVMTACSCTGGRIIAANDDGSHTCRKCGGGVKVRALEDGQLIPGGPGDFQWHPDHGFELCRCAEGACRIHLSTPVVPSAPDKPDEA